MNTNSFIGRVKKGIARVANEPVVVVAGTIAAVNASTDQSWQGYGLAALTFLVRFVVTGPFTEQ